MVKSTAEKKQYYKDYYAENREARKAYHKGKKKKHKKRVIKQQAYIRRRHRIEAMEMSLTVGQWDSILEMFGCHCIYCSRHASELVDEGGLQQDHWVPVVRGGAYTEFNMVPCCRACNMQKGTKTPSKYLASLGLGEEVMIVDETKSCPFCGEGTNLTAKRGGRYLYWIVCLKCNADGPPAATAMEASERWNRRGEANASATSSEGESDS